MSKVTKNIEEARTYLDEALEALEEQETRIQALPDDTPDEERDFHKTLFEQRREDVARARDTLERLIALRQARETVPVPDDGDDSDDGDDPAEKRGIPARYRGSSKEPLTYRADNQAERSFFYDVFAASRLGNSEAQARLQQNEREVAYETRSMSTTVTAGGNFIPPQYLGEMYAALARPGRPYADSVPNTPLMATGMNITIPRITTGSLVAAQTTQNTSLGTQDIVEALLTVPVITIGGYSDLSVQLAERAEPGFDQILFADLRNDYDRVLDAAMLNGAGSTTHLGIRAVSSIQTSTYTSATPVASGLLPKLYDAIQKIATTRYMQPDTLVLHPRRSAWFVSNLSSTFPLFQVGGLYQAAGQQDGGFVNSFAGLNIVSDPNVGTVYSVGGNTNEDEIYVTRNADMHLWEGTPRVEVFRDVGSSTGTVRIRLYAFSAFASGRFPGSICKIAGSGLSAPTF
jgi:HK97 family phage major capsid protein